MKISEPSDISTSADDVAKSEASPLSKLSLAVTNADKADETRNDDPTIDNHTDDVAITINGTTIIVVPENSVRGLSDWVDSVNDYFDLKEGEPTTEASKKPSAREKLTGSLTVMGNGVASKTVKISHGMAEWIVSIWKGQPAAASEVRDDPNKLKQKFNDFLDSLKFAIPEKSDKSVFNIAAFNDDDSAMIAKSDVEVVLAESCETEDQSMQMSQAENLDEL
ncbi:hypothetical protein HJC23_005440 [Cyclotella cryptica]|uniref:Uncharacterized protein n=1 Tax=Cyclotella cryptica TaxID=29204 RepID=A0ABD3P3S8_9STRA